LVMIEEIEGARGSLRWRKSMKTFCSQLFHNLFQKLTTQSLQIPFRCGRPA
jgi:hypothetical protein